MPVPRLRPPQRARVRSPRRAGGRHPARPAAGELPQAAAREPADRRQDRRPGALGDPQGLEAQGCRGARGDAGQARGPGAVARSPSGSRSRFDVRKPRVRQRRLPHTGRCDGRPDQVRGGEQPRRTVRRRVLLRRRDHRHLLPAELPRRHPQTRQRALLPDGGRRTGGRLPGLPAVPPRRRARLRRVERPRRCRRPRHAADRRRRGGPRGRPRPRRAARLQRPAGPAPAQRRAGRRTRRARPRPALPHRPGPPPDHRPARHRDRLRGRVRQRAPVQRHHPPDLRPHPQRPARGGRDRARRGPGSGAAGRDPATARPSGPVRRRRPVRPAGGWGRGPGRGDGRGSGAPHLPAYAAAAVRDRDRRRRRGIARTVAGGPDPPHRPARPDHRRTAAAAPVRPGRRSVRRRRGPGRRSPARPAGRRPPRAALAGGGGPGGGGRTGTGGAGPGGRAGRAVREGAGRAVRRAHPCVPRAGRPGRGRHRPRPADPDRRARRRGAAAGRGGRPGGGGAGARHAARGGPAERRADPDAGARGPGCRPLRDSGGRAVAAVALVRRTPSGDGRPSAPDQRAQPGPRHQQAREELHQHRVARRPHHRAHRRPTRATAAQPQPLRPVDRPHEPGDAADHGHHEEAHDPRDPADHHRPAGRARLTRAARRQQRLQGLVQQHEGRCADQDAPGRRGHVRQRPPQHRRPDDRLARHARYQDPDQAQQHDQAHADELPHTHSTSLPESAPLRASAHARDLRRRGRPGRSGTGDPAPLVRVPAQLEPGGDPGQLHQSLDPALHGPEPQLQLFGHAGVGQPGQQQRKDLQIGGVGSDAVLTHPATALTQPQWHGLPPHRLEEAHERLQQPAGVHDQRGGLGAPPGQRHHRRGPVGDHQLRRHPVDHPALLVPAQRGRQLQDPRRQRQHLALDDHPVDHPARGRPLLGLVLHAGHRDRLAGDQGAHLGRRAQLQLVEALGDRRRTGHHLHQIVHLGLARLRPVLRGQQRGRQLRLLQLVALLDQQGPQRHARRRRHPAARAGRGLRGQTLLLQPPQHPLGVRLRERQPVREIGEFRRSRRHQRPVRGFLPLVETQCPQHLPTLPGCGDRVSQRPFRPVRRGGKGPRRKPAAHIIPCTPGPSASLAPLRYRRPAHPMITPTGPPGVLPVGGGAARRTSCASHFFLMSRFRAAFAVDNKGMSQQGEKPAAHEDDWWRKLYDETAPDTGPSSAPDSLDDRFDSVSDTVSEAVEPESEREPEPLPEVRPDPRTAWDPYREQAPPSEEPARKPEPERKPESEREPEPVPVATQAAVPGPRNTVFPAPGNPRRSARPPHLRRAEAARARAAARAAHPARRRTRHRARPCRPA
ncbi:protein of unknown function [Streptomyces sp. KY70]|nr:protein of unknown function [Streptomyces sp. KY70]